MPNPTLTGQDEARRALALKLEHYCQRHAGAVQDDQPHAARLIGKGFVDIISENLPIILAALRAPSLDRGAEEMRERAAKLCEDIADGKVGRISVTAASASLRCAQNIRALPVPADLNEGG